MEKEQTRSQGKREEYIELLAPGGDLQSIKAAIVSGADAVYCGLDRFNARNRAVNISFADLVEAIELAHQHHCQIFLTLNILIVESEIPALVTLLTRLANSKIDGVIVQDLGLFYILQKYFPTLIVHASTQCTTHNHGQIEVLKTLGAVRTNLCRELTLSEIEDLSEYSQKHGMETEVFVHGANCIGFSGLCLFSSVHGGQSGNRGRCSQPCRKEYQDTAMGKSYPLNLKDNSLFHHVDRLIDAGVDSLKIEGRIKKFHYVSEVVRSYRQQIDTYQQHGEMSRDDDALRQVFNRDFSALQLAGNLGADSFIDNPRDHSALWHSGASETSLQGAKQEIYDLRTGMIRSVEERISALSQEPRALRIIVTGEIGQPLSIRIEAGTEILHIKSDSLLEPYSETLYSLRQLRAELAPLADCNYQLDVDVSGLPRMVRLANDSTILELVYPALMGRLYQRSMQLPAVEKRSNVEEGIELAVIISAYEDIAKYQEVADKIYFLLPSNLSGLRDGDVDTLLTACAQPKVVPYFPSLLLGDDFIAAEKLIAVLPNQTLLLDNLGLVPAAQIYGKSWEAGPAISIANRFAMICLAENLGASGGFISGELGKRQLLSIHPPANFKLNYALYHPQQLMISRYCFFQTVTGCYKKSQDADCLKNCSKKSELIDLDGKKYHLVKEAGNYQKLYSENFFFNPEIIADIQAKRPRFSCFTLDLRNIPGRGDGLLGNEIEFIKRIRNYIQTGQGAEELSQMVAPTNHGQYEGKI